MLPVWHIVDYKDGDHLQVGKLQVIAGQRLSPGASGLSLRICGGS